MSLSGYVWETVIVNPRWLNSEYLLVNIKQELVAHPQDLGLLPIPRNIDTEAQSINDNQVDGVFEGGHYVEVKHLVNGHLDEINDT
jgi:hypothetical protein